MQEIKVNEVGSAPYLLKYPPPHEKYSRGTARRAATHAEMAHKGIEHGRIFLLPTISSGCIRHTEAYKQILP